MSEADGSVSWRLRAAVVGVVVALGVAAIWLSHAGNAYANDVGWLPLLVGAAFVGYERTRRRTA